VLYELNSHGLDEGTVGAVKDELLADEEERAWSVWQKKFGTPADNAADAARQQRFLQQRGFSNTSIRAVMRRSARQDVATG
jgi:regulatory protein